ncbi:MAG: hypothetical protein E7368_03975 [Clostridiales bacterium]|nr:hypothetical protein [Clostridiales bacterium]
MAEVKKTFKKIGRQIWELFKGSLPTSLMFMCAGAALVIVSIRGELSQWQWNGAKIAWTIVLIVAASAYACVMAYVNGGNGYEMLVTGNMKRMSSTDSGTSLKINKYVYAKEYRAWKGFVIGAFVGLVPVIAGIFFGANQTKIDTALMNLMAEEDAQLGGMGFGLIMVIFLFISGYSVIPFLIQNATGASISYYYGCLFGLIPVVVVGVMYIAGAYGRRAKAIRKQEMADREAQMEANRQKKINYGALPGTKPKKRK